MQLTEREKSLLKNLKSLVATERKTLTAILEHLQRVYDTRLFAKLGYSSLHKYLIKELGYSESAAYRRVQALRLVKEVPKTKKMIEDGEVNLTNITHLQTFLKDKDTGEKIRALESIKHQSSNEAKKTLFDFAPEQSSKPRDHKRQVSQKHTRLSMTVSNTTMEKMKKVQAQTKKYDNDELLNYLLDLALAANTPKRNRKVSKQSTNPRTISAAVKRHVTTRANKVCEYPGCDEIHYLEFDHIKPVAHCGKNNSENIRLLCRAHNQLAAIEKLGASKMKKYF